MVDVTHAVVSNGGSGSTEPTIRDAPGQWLVMVAVDRSGGESAQFTSTHPEMDAAMSQVVGLATRPTNTTYRRGVWVWAGVVPEGLTGTFIIDMDVFDGSETSVDCSWIAVLTDMDASWSVEGFASDDSFESTTTSQSTGTTPNAPAGETFTISALSARGSTTVTWANSDDTPPNPGGGDWDLNVDTIADSVNSRRGSVGVGDLGSQPSQTYSDTATLGTARMATAAIAVWVQGDMPVSASLDADLPGLTASFDATHEQTVDGELAAVLPALTASLEADVVQSVAATFSGSLPMLRSTASAATSNPLFSVDIRPRRPDILRAFPTRWPKG